MMKPLYPETDSNLHHMLAAMKFLLMKTILTSDKTVHEYMGTAKDLNYVVKEIDMLEEFDIPVTIRRDMISNIFNKEYAERFDYQSMRIVASCTALALTKSHAQLWEGLVCEAASKVAARMPVTSLGKSDPSPES